MQFKIMYKAFGLTLIELLVTLSIVAILTMIAYPYYQHHIVQTYRTRAIQNLLLLSKNLHTYYLQNHRYQNANIKLLSTDIQADQHYHYSIANVTTQTYQLIAAPLGKQAKNDKACGKLIINQFGEQNTSGNGKITDCWPR